MVSRGMETRVTRRAGTRIYMQPRWLGFNNSEGRLTNGRQRLCGRSTMLLTRREEETVTG